jgi:hypothetical protein
MSTIQRSDQKLWPFWAVIPVWRDNTSSSTSRDSIDTTRKTASRNYYKTLTTIQRSDQNLWPFWAVITVWLDNTASSTSRDSIGTTRKTASGNYCRTLSVIQREDQNLWPFSAVIPVWRDKTFSSTSKDSIDTTTKTPPETTVKFSAQSNGRIKCYGPFELLLRSGATIPPLQQVGIP